MCSCGDGSFAFDGETPQPDEAVAVLEPAAVCVENPAAEGASLGDDHSLRSRLGHNDLGRDRVRAVLDVEHRTLGQAAHASEQELRVAVNELRAAGEIGVEALDAAVVE